MAVATAAAATIAGPTTVPIDKVETVYETVNVKQKQYVCDVKPRYIRYANFERVEYIRECGHISINVPHQTTKFKIFFTVNSKQVSMVVDEVPGRFITIE